MLLKIEILAHGWKRSGLPLLMGLVVLVLTTVGAQPVAGEAAVLAVVNGDVITRDQVFDRVAMLHRGRPLDDLQKDGAGALDLFGVVDRLVDEQLMIQEARRVGLDHSEDFRKKLDAVIKRESILRLRREEVLDKSAVGEAEIIAFLQSRHGDRWREGEALSPVLRRRIERELRREKEKSLSERFFARLRDGAEIRVDEKWLREADMNDVGEEDQTIIGRVDGRPITVEDLLDELENVVDPMASRHSGHKRTGRGQIDISLSAKEKAVDRLITYILVEQEALRRDYMANPDFSADMEKKKEQLLLRAFKSQLVYPLAVPQEEDLKQYYRDHPDEFKEGYEVWIREMRFQDREQAENILEELRQGASFTYLASQVSEGPTERKDAIWIKINRFPKPVRKVIQTLQVGEFSPVISLGRHFKIVQMKGKRGGRTIPYGKVVERLKKVVTQKRYERILDEYVTKLRESADVKIHYEKLRAMEAELVESSRSDGGKNDETDDTE